MKCSMPSSAPSASLVMCMSTKKTAFLVPLHFQKSSAQRLCRGNAIRQHNKRLAADHFASKQLPASFRAWRQHSGRCKDKQQAVQQALRHWLHASLASAFAAWRGHSEEQAVLKDKLQHAVAVMSQVGLRSRLGPCTTCLHFVRAQSLERSRHRTPPGHLCMLSGSIVTGAACTGP